jgi:hypothetical protein
MMDYEKFKTGSLERPDSFADFSDLPMFQPGGWGFAGISLTRDSDPLARSNYRAACKKFFKLDEIEDIEKIDEPEDSPFKVYGASHWACGWVDHIIVNHADEDALRLAFSVHEDLEQYPVLDEEDFSEEEERDQHLTLTNCFDCNEDEAWAVISACHEESREVDGLNDDEVTKMLNEHHYIEPSELELTLDAWTEGKAEHAVVTTYQRHVRISFSDGRTAGFPTTDAWAAPAIAFATKHAESVEVIEGES